MTEPATIVMPCFGDGPFLRRALEAIAPAVAAGHQLILVDDGSPRPFAPPLPPGAELVVRSTNGGPAAARNDGVRLARHEVVVFVDADVIVRADTVDRLAAHLRRKDGPDAVFGAYDALPTHPSLVSRWRNLLHHHTHRTGDSNAETFWAGCGAVRRSAFDRVGGFDAARFPSPSVEDIDFGYRLRDVGGRILLDPTIESTHLKAWTLADVIRTDVFRRAVPWARLLAGRRRGTRALNVGGLQRFAGVASVVAFAAAAMIPFVGETYRWATSGVVLAGLGMMMFVNAGFFGLLRRSGGIPLLAVGVLLQWMFYVYGSAAFAYGTLVPAKRA